MRLNLAQKSKIDIFRRNEQTRNQIKSYLVVDQSVDWLYQRLYILVQVKLMNGQKEFRIASCNLGKKNIQNCSKIDLKRDKVFNSFAMKYKLQFNQMIITF